MKSLILCLSLIWVLGCATDEVEGMAGSEIGVVTPVDAPPITIVRSSATSPILGVQPGSGGAFDPEICTEYPIGCDPETGACSYFPSGCGQGGGGAGGGGGSGGGGGWGTTCWIARATDSSYCEWLYCGAPSTPGNPQPWAPTGYRVPEIEYYYECSNGSYYYETVQSQIYWDPGSCPIDANDICWPNP